MGKVKIPYYVVRRGRGYWQPNAKMAKGGARCVSCGPDGPEAWTKATVALDAWRTFTAKEEQPRHEPAHLGTLARAFEEYRATDEWSAKSLRTREEWERCWARIGPAFGGQKPNEITLAHISNFRLIVKRNVSLVVGQSEM